MINVHIFFEQFYNELILKKPILIAIVVNSVLFFGDFIGLDKNYDQKYTSCTTQTLHEPYVVFLTNKQLKGVYRRLKNTVILESKKSNTDFHEK